MGLDGFLPMGLGFGGGGGGVLDGLWVLAGVRSRVGWRLGETYRHILWRP